jgi:hypothetical protein
MADNPTVQISFAGKCPDCGQRTVHLPAPLPEVGDDFDWQVRDYDGFRLFMMQELAARFPDRVRWTPADVEVTLVEVLAAALDQLSDTLDRVAAESYLETARRPESVRRLLRLIGYDALALAQARQEGPFDPTRASEGDTRSDPERLDRYWLDNPQVMEQARQEGPRSIHTQRRMITLDDHQARLEEHPLVSRAQAWAQWSGAWPVVYVAVIPTLRQGLDESGVDYPVLLQEAVTQFHRERDLPLPLLDLTTPLRTVLNPYVETYRMLGQEVILRDAVEVGILISLSIQVNPNYFQSELRHAVERALGTGPEGFFTRGRLRFGEDLFAGDIFQTVMGLDGVDNVCLNRFKRVGDRFPDQSESGRIVLSGLEVATCDNDTALPARGYYYLTLEGGRKG